MDVKNYIGECKPILDFTDEASIKKSVYDMDIEYSYVNHHDKCNDLISIAKHNLPCVSIIFLGNHRLELEDGDVLLLGEIMNNFGDFFDVFCGIKIHDWIFCIHIFKDNPEGMVVGHHKDRFYVFREINLDNQGKFRNEYIQWIIDVVKPKLS